MTRENAKATELLEVRVALDTGFEADTDRSRLDLAKVHAWLSTDAYWALGRSFDVVSRAAAASVNYFRIPGS